MLEKTWLESSCILSDLELVRYLWSLFAIALHLRPSFGLSNLMPPLQPFVDFCLFIGDLWTGNLGQSLQCHWYQIKNKMLFMDKYGLCHNLHHDSLGSLGTEAIGSRRIWIHYQEYFCSILNSIVCCILQHECHQRCMDQIGRTER